MALTLSEGCHGDRAQPTAGGIEGEIRHASEQNS